MYKRQPVCNAMILSSAVEEYRYIDTSTKQEKYFKRDLDNINEIIYDEDVIKDNMMKIPVYACLLYTSWVEKNLLKVLWILVWGECTLQPKKSANL